MRLFGTLAVVMVFTGVAVADIPIPPLAKDEKEIPVTSQVLLGKDVTGYIFVQQIGVGPGDPRYSYKKVELDQKKPMTMPREGQYLYVSLFAIPEAAAKEYKTDADLYAALEAGKVKGAHHAGVGSSGTWRVKKDEVKGDSITRTYTITAIDPKDGVKTTKESDEPKKDEPKKPLAFAEPGTLVGGIAAAVAVTLGGLWLVRRKR